MSKSWKQGLLAAILGIVVLAIPNTFTIILGPEEDTPFYLIFRWIWGYRFLLAYAILGFPGLSGLFAEVDITITVISFILGVILAIICIVLLVMAILSKKLIIPKLATQITFIILGVLLLTLPWIDFLVTLLTRTDIYIAWGMSANAISSPTIPIPIGPIIFAVGGIFAIIGGAKA
jgi:hypothetical protein